MLLVLYAGKRPARPSQIDSSRDLRLLSALIVIAKAADPRLDGRLGVTFLLVRFLLQRLDLRLHLLFGLLEAPLVLLEPLPHPFGQAINPALYFRLPIAACLGMLCFELVEFGAPGSYLA